jgi:hypothetical protein
MKLRTFGYALFIAVAAVAFAIGSASTGEAKGKKKAAAAPPAQPMPCLYAPPAPVCGSLKGHKFSYANSCAAYKDGATIVSQKACPMKAMMGKKHKAKKAMKMKPAKAMKSDMKKPDAKAEKKKM